jgi:sugar lactone lactonase YvrE
MGVALDSAGDVYVADNANDEIRKIVPSGVVITLAGSPRQNGSSNGVGSAARFSFPEGVAVDSAGNVYVADNFNCEIRLVSGGSTSLAGGDTAAFSESFDTRNAGTGKTLTAAGSVNDGNSGSNYAVTFATATTGQITPLAITVTAVASSKVYDGTTSSTATPTIPTGDVVTTLAGSARLTGSSNGTGSAARFDYPAGVAVDSAGNLYVADREDDEIRKISPSGVVTTLAGYAGQQGSVDGTGSSARFNFPTGVAVDSAGNVYVADWHNDEIRKISPSGVVTTLAGSPEQTGSSDGSGSVTSQ